MQAVEWIRQTDTRINRHTTCEVLFFSSDLPSPFTSEGRSAKGRWLADQWAKLFPEPCMLFSRDLRLAFHGTGVSVRVRTCAPVSPRCTQPPWHTPRALLIHLLSLFSLFAKLRLCVNPFLSLHKSQRPINSFFLSFSVFILLNLKTGDRRAIWPWRGKCNRGSSFTRRSIGHKMST